MLQRRSTGFGGSKLKAQRQRLLADGLLRSCRLPCSRVTTAVAVVGRALCTLVRCAPNESRWILYLYIYSPPQRHGVEELVTNSPREYQIMQVCMMAGSVVSVAIEPVQFCAVEHHHCVCTRTGRDQQRRIVCFHAITCEIAIFPKEVIKLYPMRSGALPTSATEHGAP